MKHKFMGRNYEEFIKVVCEMYKKEEGLNITDCQLIGDTEEYELDSFEDCGGGVGSVGSFRVAVEELHERIRAFETIPLHYARKEYMSAIEAAWTEKKILLIYPDDMDLIVVDVPREELCYLTKTYTVYSQLYDTKEKLENEVKSLVVVF